MKKKSNKYISNLLFIIVVISIFTSYINTESNSKSVSFSKQLDKVNIDPKLLNKIQVDFPKILSENYNLSEEEVKYIIENAIFEEWYIKESNSTNLFNKKIKFTFSGKAIVWKSQEFISILDVYSETFSSKNNLLKPVSIPKINILELRPYSINNNKDILKLNASVEVILKNDKQPSPKTLSHYFIFN